MENKQIIAEAKRIKKQYEKETGQTFPLGDFVEQVKSINKTGKRVTAVRPA